MLNIWTWLTRQWRQREQVRRQRREPFSPLRAACFPPAAITHLLTNIIYRHRCQRCPRPLFCHFSPTGLLFPAVPVALLLCAEPNGAFVLLSAPVTCSPPPPILYRPSLRGPTCVCFSSLSLTMEVRWGVWGGVVSGEWVFAPGRGADVKERGTGVGNETWAHPDASLGCLLINFVCLISGVFFSAPILWCEKRKKKKRMVHSKPESITR